MNTKQFQYAIYTETTYFGKVYVDSNGKNVCCPADSARANGYTRENVLISLQKLKQANSDLKFQMEEI